MEQGAGALGRARREDRCVDQGVAVVVKELPHRLDDGGADLHDRLLPRRTQPQVAVAHQEVGAVRLARDRIVGHVLGDVNGADVDLDAAGRAFVGARRAGEFDRGFLAEMGGGVEVLADGFLDDALHVAGGDPAAQPDGFADVVFQFADRDEGCFDGTHGWDLA